MKREILNRTETWLTRTTKEWSQVEESEPELAVEAQKIFELHGAEQAAKLTQALMTRLDVHWAEKEHAKGEAAI